MGQLGQFVSTNLDPLGEYSDQEIREVLNKCRLAEIVGQDKRYCSCSEGYSEIKMLPQGLHSGIYGRGGIIHIEECTS